MQLNIKELNKLEPGSTESYEISERVAKLDEFALEGPVAGSARVTKLANSMLASFELHLTAVLECVRCLDKIMMKFKLKFDEEFPEGVYAKSGMIDYTEAVREEFVVRIPIQPLCRPGCKGLCDDCGLNLNHDPHTHEDEERFDRVKDRL